MSDAAVPLPTTLAECHAKLLEQQATIDEQQTMLEAMQRDLTSMKRIVFGQRRERFEDPRQGTLFDSLLVGDVSEDDKSDESKQGEQPAEEALPDADSPNADSSNTDESSTSTRSKGRGRRVFPKCLPREQRIRKLTDEEIAAASGDTDARRFLKKTGEWIDLKPPSMTVIEEFVEVLAVDNADATETTMVTARRPERILNSFAGPSLLAGLAVNHFSDHLPYYRLEDILQRSGMVIDRSTQCRWMTRLAKKLTPLTDLMRMLVLESLIVLADETPVKMLVPGLGRTSTTYLWAILGDRQRPYTTFSFTESRARAGPIRFFANFSGTLLCDAYVGYECLVPYTEGRILLAGCHAHARRKFEELHALGATVATSTALGYFQRLFDLEDEFRELSDEARHAQRQVHSRPLLMEFKRWMDTQLETLRPKHNLRGAINYMTSRWECFERFLESGAIAIDNNASEQAVKNAVMGKKNWMFFGGPAGGHTAAVFYTLTATCRRLHIDPFAYLNDVFERLPQLLPADQADSSNELTAETRALLTPLLPDQWLAAHPESQLQHRVTESKTKSARRRQRRAQRRKALARANRQRS